MTKALTGGPNLGEIRNRRLAFGLIAPRDNDRRAAFQQAARDTLANATVTAGYDGDFASEIEPLHFHCPPKS
jgi:hypothetical protein